MPSPRDTPTTTGQMPTTQDPSATIEHDSRHKHTYRGECRLAPVPQPEHDAWLEGIPPINAQFFYSSPIPIDDPLSTAAAASATFADGRSSRHASRPFSQGDNNALETSWLGLASHIDRDNHKLAVKNQSPDSTLLQANVDKLAVIARGLAEKHHRIHSSEDQGPGSVRASRDAAFSTIPICCPELPIDASNELREVFCAVTRQTLSMLDENKLVHDVMSRMRTINSPSPTTRQTTRNRKPSVSAPDMPSVGPGISMSSKKDLNDVGPIAMAGSQRSISREGVERLPERIRQSIVDDDGLSGKPFVRVDSPAPNRSRQSSVNDRATITAEASETVRAATVSPRIQTQSTDDQPLTGKQHTSIDIPVGISRLHLVSLPLLQMKPLYWSPVNDIAVVLRATWFDQETMTPLEPALANELEAGYRELRPWTDTWQDEVRCAINVGPLGEEKVAHQLWVDEKEQAKRSREASKRAVSMRARISSDPFCAARCFRGEAAAEGTLEAVKGGIDDDGDEPPSIYHNHQVIYKDAISAFLLKPSLQPSAYYNRRPLAKIAKGISVGIPVVRGFDRRVWDRVHGKVKGTPPKDVPPPLAGDNPEAGHGITGCAGCELEKKSQQVTDLLLVTHGIGQKLAERHGSWHFTHAINAFRRSINIDLASDSVKTLLRDDHNGIMVLPVNWRLAVSFDDVAPAKDGEVDRGSSGFELKDVEPKTIPAVRSMISDVMFDIPFYMSPQHRPKMIDSLVQEANRVYRLWCSNNPGFAEKGRVHLIGHSLGSAMAVDILSKQPTRVPPLDLTMPLPRTMSFEFDTTNLFLLGSPAAFFLLLERGKLLPRRGRVKPGCDQADTVSEDVVGEAGTLGCLAVDNIYNILAREDPIAYLLNGTIDPVYASSLATAFVPSTSAGFLASISQTMRGLVSGTSSTPNQALHDGSGVAPPRPSTLRLPSQLEMEIHDFTREENAERKAFLLNDNGQIDYYLRSGGGPLDVQYLNMLSAHTSYWTNQDLVRLLCVEIGRKPGRANTIVPMRALKASKKLLPLPVSK